MTKEEYIDISEYGYDENKGIWSKTKEKFLKGTVNKRGYVQVTLKCVDGKKRTFLYHRAMWYLAYGAIPEGMQVNHIDENKQNNALSNLNLMTQKENINWGTGIERRAAKQRGVLRPDVSERFKGISRPYMIKQNKLLKSKPVVAVDKNNNVVYEFASTCEAGRNGFTQGCVAACCRGEKQTHKGLRWYYKSDWEQMQIENASPHKREDAYQLEINFV